MLIPHWSDANQLVASFGCSADFSITGGHELKRSSDRGVTRTSVSAEKGRESLGPVGGQYADGARLYLADGNYRLFGSSVLRSDDDGSTWDEVLTLPSAHRDGNGALLPSRHWGRLAAVALDPDYI